MTRDATALLNDVLRLPEHERMELAARLLANKSRVMMDLIGRRQFSALPGVEQFVRGLWRDRPLAICSGALREEIETSIRGRDLASGLPRELTLSSEEVRSAIASPLAEIMAAIHATLEETPPELAADITTEGVLLAGGGSLLRGFDERVARETGMPVRLAEDPLACVATGAGMSLEELDTLPRGRRHRTA